MRDIRLKAQFLSWSFAKLWELLQNDLGSVEVTWNRVIYTRGSFAWARLFQNASAVDGHAEEAARCKLQGSTEHGCGQEGNARGKSCGMWQWTALCSVKRRFGSTEFTTFPDFAWAGDGVGCAALRWGATVSVDWTFGCSSSTASSVTYPPGHRRRLRCSHRIAPSLCGFHL